MAVDVLDVLAVIFGILFTIRKLDASRREAQDYPHVEPGAFEAWRRRESGIYSVGSLACFLKVVLDVGFLLLVAPGLAPGLVRTVGAIIDLAWLVVLTVTLVRASAVRKERRRLDIVLR